MAALFYSAAPGVLGDGPGLEDALVLVDELERCMILLVEVAVPLWSFVVRAIHLRLMGGWV